MLGFMLARATFSFRIRFWISSFGFATFMPVFQLAVQLQKESKLARFLLEYVIG